ncbi:hypothetical protein E2C01_061756 [Portunus trituberculatus]|uniref:Uncharacterized protein n=1 Tax=Portunus trituberculatus TaxID=210409 RepID=A0A5B7H643_PORTR|nr:hypothetical protein [Portunus trituberculatus]
MNEAVTRAFSVSRGRTLPSCSPQSMVARCGGSGGVKGRAANMLRAPPSCRPRSASRVKT